MCLLISYWLHDSAQVIRFKNISRESMIWKQPSVTVHCNIYFSNVTTYLRVVVDQVRMRAVCWTPVFWSGSWAMKATPRGEFTLLSWQKSLECHVMSWGVLFYSMLPESPPDSCSERSSPPQIPGEISHPHTWRLRCLTGAESLCHVHRFRMDESRVGSSGL